MEQKAKETLRAWIEPWTPLRVPLIFHLRRDPYERAYFTSNTYYDWLIDRIFFLVPAQTYVARFLAPSRNSRHGRSRAASVSATSSIRSRTTSALSSELHVGAVAGYQVHHCLAGIRTI